MALRVVGAHVARSRLEIETAKAIFSMTRMKVFQMSIYCGFSCRRRTNQNSLANVRIGNASNSFPFLEQVHCNLNVIRYDRFQACNWSCRYYYTEIAIHFVNVNGFSHICSAHRQNKLTRTSVTLVYWLGKTLAVRRTDRLEIYYCQVSVNATTIHH